MLRGGHLVLALAATVASPAQASRCGTKPRLEFARICAEPGFSDAVQPFVADSSPRDMDAWRKRMAPHVPCIIAALGSADPCHQELAAYLLGAIGDQRAIAPILAMLPGARSDPPFHFALRQVLAEKLKAQEVVPFLIEALAAKDGQRRFSEILLIRDAPHDARLVDVLVRTFEAEPAEYRSQLLEAMGRQSGGEVVDGRVKEILWQALDEKPELPGAWSLAYGAMRKEDFPRLGSWLLHRAPSDGNGQLAGYFGILKQLDVEAVPAFARKALSEPLSPYWQRALSDALLDAAFPGRHDPYRSIDDTLSALEAMGTEALAHAPPEKLREIVVMSADASPKAAVYRRIAFWERATTIFAGRSDILGMVHYMLAQSYGIDGAGNLEEAARHMRLALAADPPRKSDDYRLQSLSEMQCLLAGQTQADGIAIRELVATRRGDGTVDLAGRIVGWPAGTRVGSPAACLIDVLADGDLKSTVEGSCRIEERSEGLLVHAELPLNKDKASRPQRAAVRLRLLFLPRSTGQIGATVSSDIVAVPGS